MVPRTHFIALALVTALMAFATLPAAAQSGRTFYIDYSSGSNSNPGTKASPWKTHPYMQTGSGCTDGVAGWGGYSHEAGDHFIFKGGVTWPVACLSMVVNTGGSSASSVPNAATLNVNGADYYGADTSWFAGNSFTRPVFDAANTQPAGPDYGAIIVTRANNITFDNLELKRNLITGGNFPGSTMDLTGSNGITVDHLYIHDWTIASLANLDHWSGSISATNTTTSVNVYNTEMSDAGTTAPTRFGSCFVYVYEVAYNNCHNTGEGGLFTHGPFHDNQIHDLDGNIANAASGVHSNGYESDDGPAPSFYNNYLYNLNVGYDVICPGTAFYNNVISNVYNSGMSIDTNCAYTTSATQTHVYNNTIDTTGSIAGQSFASIRIVARSGGQSGVVTIENNISIGNGFDLSGATTSPSTSNNYTMSTSEAATYGFTSANKYAPTSSDPHVEGQGVNLLSSLSASLLSVLQPLAEDPGGAPWFGGSYIARGSTWGLGAFVFGSQSASSSSKPNPPTNLTASVQ